MKVGVFWQIGKYLTQAWMRGMIMVGVGARGMPFFILAAS